MPSSKRLLSWTIALLCCATFAHASNTWDTSAADLARQIAALTGPGTITLAVTDRSSIPNDDVPSIRRALERELRSAGVIVREKNADSEVRVTLSQNMQGWLWVAEVQEGSEIKVAMLPVPGAGAAENAVSAPVMTVRAALIHAQPEPILDVLQIGMGAQDYVLVLGPDKLTWYLKGHPERQAQSKLALYQPLPRDLRGRIWPGSSQVEIFLPGTMCGVKDMNVSCSNSDAPWPLGAQSGVYNPTRNFFTGLVGPAQGVKLPPFYSEADLYRKTSEVYLFADVTGTVHVVEGHSHKLLIGARDWGSDIAGVRSDCGSGAQVLASAAGSPASDSIRAYEISGREATPASAPVNLDGTITALWPATDGTSATAVVRKRDGYEAYSISVACSH